MRLMREQGARSRGVKLAILALALTGAHATSYAGTPVSSRIGEAFRDCATCPQMLPLPGGSFTIGSSETQVERYRSESPQREIQVPPIAVSETEITRGQYAAFVAATGRPTPGGCRTHGDGSSLTGGPHQNASWRAPGFMQSDDHPVVCVSWLDARAYVQWLSSITDREYRLPGEAEWEYAARAGTVSAFFFGESGDNACSSMNGGDQSLARALPPWGPAIEASAAKGELGARLIACDDGYAFTAPVGRYAANAFGLRDMAGNAWEWVEDCYHPSYAEISANGAPYVVEGCDQRRTRGGSWDDYPIDLRSSVRKRLPPEQARDNVGFRVVASPSKRR